MYFTIRYNNGYEVCVVKTDDDGCLRTHPLRNFGERQGDAMLFKQHDCPRLRWEQINALIKRYDPARKYNRYNERTFLLQQDNEND